MGNSAGLMSYRRQSKIATEMREDNVRLQARIQQMSEEASKLRAEMHEIARRCSNERATYAQNVIAPADEMCPLSTFGKS